MTHQQETTNRLWNLCNILRESGITYPEYVTELTYLLFLKLAQQTGSEDSLPLGFRWQDLSTKNNNDQLPFYKRLLSALGASESLDVRAIFGGADTALRKPKHLQLLVSELDSINWRTELQEDTLGDIYEGLLEKNSAESKSGAGQYFTPRPVVESIVGLVKPQPGELIQDPACGTGGFLIAADRQIKRSREGGKTQNKGEPLLVGIELVRDTQRLALMNAMLHRISAKIICGDTLDEDGVSLESADVILTNPPFGTKSGAGVPDRPFPFPTSNKQLAFLQHIYLGLRAGGRAAVVLPDMQGRIASLIISDLMEKCDLHTVLRLPTGIFYALGVKTNVYFFTRGATDTNNTKQVWIYDLRSKMPNFNKSNPLTSKHFAEFEKVFGPNPHGKSRRVDQGEHGRFRCFSRDYLRENGDRLDVTWLVSDKDSDWKSGPSSDALAKRIMKGLQSAVKELEALQRG